MNLIAPFFNCFDADGTKLLVKYVCETAPNSFFMAPTWAPRFEFASDWPAKKAIIGLPVRLVGNLRRISGNSLSPLGASYKDIDAASQTLLIWVRLCLRRLLTLADEAPLFRLHQAHFHITKYDFSACQFMTVYRLNM